MTSTESGREQGPTAARRTENDRRRRQALADHAYGHAPGEDDLPALTKKVERFRVVLYLCAAPHSDITTPRRECADYAEAFGWAVADTIEDHVGPLPPRGREGLTRAIELVEKEQADAVLTPWRSMISTVPQEYDEMAREVERAGGFLHVMDTDRPSRPRRPRDTPGCPNRPDGGA